MTPKDTRKDEDAHRAAMTLLREGLVNPSEAADLAGVSRQLVRHWLLAAGVDWRKQRDAYLAKRWRRALNRGARIEREE